MRCRTVFFSMALTAAVGFAGPAMADPWKDESGHGRWRDRYEGHDRDWRDHRRFDDGWRDHRRRDAPRCRFERFWDGDEWVETRRCRERGWRGGWDD